MFTLPKRDRKLFEGINDFVLLKEIGYGGFSVVYQARHKGNGNDYAIKIVDFAKISIADQQNVQKEIIAHKAMCHKNIVTLYDFFIERSVVYLVLEFCKGGSLFFYMQNHTNMSDNEIKRLFKQTCDAVDYIHQKGFINRDIKPENLLLDIHNNIKLCDFGWAAHMTDKGFRRLRAGTISYMSPESLLATTQGPSSDIWALGVLLYEMYHSREPYCGVSCSDQLNKIKSTLLVFYNNNMPNSAKRLVQAILHYEAYKRPTMRDIHKDIYLADYQYVETKPIDVIRPNRGISVHPYEPVLHLDSSNTNKSDVDLQMRYKTNSSNIGTPIKLPVLKPTMDDTLPIKLNTDRKMRMTKNRNAKVKQQDSVAQQLRRYKFRGEKALNNAKLNLCQKPSDETGVTIIHITPLNSKVRPATPKEEKRPSRAYSTNKYGDSTGKQITGVYKDINKNILQDTGNFQLSLNKLGMQVTRPISNYTDRQRGVSSNLNSRTRPVGYIPIAPTQNIPLNITSTPIDIDLTKVPWSTVPSPKVQEYKKLKESGFQFYD